MMRNPMNDCELAKILVKRDENTLLAIRNFENLGIAWINFPLATPDHVVTGFLEGVPRPTPHAGIEQ
jgi:hypothetical protein